MPLPWGCHWETVAVTVSALCIRCQQRTRECESGGEVGEILPLLPGQLRCWAGAEEDQGAQEAEPLGSDSWRCLSGDGSMTGVFSRTQRCRERCDTLHTDAVQSQLSNLAAAGLPQSSSGKAGAEAGCPALVPMAP